MLGQGGADRVLGEPCILELVYTLSPSHTHLMAQVTWRPSPITDSGDSHR